MPSTLADILAAVIREHWQHINDIAERFDDGPIEISLHWHPLMSKVECVVRVVDHLPPYRVDRVERVCAPGMIRAVTIEASGAVT